MMDDITFVEVVDKNFEGTDEPNTLSLISILHEDVKLTNQDYTMQVRV